MTSTRYARRFLYVSVATNVELDAEKCSDIFVSEYDVFYPTITIRCGFRGERRCLLIADPNWTCARLHQRVTECVGGFYELVITHGMRVILNSEERIPREILYDVIHVMEISSDTAIDLPD